MIGNPLATPTCTEAKLNADNCPAASDVGDISNDVKIGALLPQTATGQIYNVVPRAGEPARFGFVLSAPPADKIILQSPASLRPSDFGLDTTLSNLPQTAKVGTLSLPIDISGVDFTLKGKVGSPAQGFLRNPTSCGSHAVGITAGAYDGQTATAATTFNTNNCDAQPFSPKFSARIAQRGTLLEPVEVSTTISQAGDEAGLKRAIVTLPKELGANATAFANTCPDSSFQSGTCPAITVVGSASAASPLQAEPLTGPVILITSAVPGGFPSLGLDLRGSLGLKLAGAIGLDATDPTAVRTAVTFDGLPDIPISDFTLTFTDGPAGLNLAARSPCQMPAFSFKTAFLGHSDQVLDSNTDASATCGSKPAKKPRAKVKLGKLGSVHPALALKLKAGGAKIKSAKVALPRGLKLGSKSKLKRGTEVAGASVKGKGRKLTLKAKGGGVGSIKSRFTKGAIVAKKGLKAKKLKPFKFKIKDADGKTTKLTVRAK